MTILKWLVEFIAIYACALFAGAALYVELVEHPARMECGTNLALTEFGPSYRRGTIMQVSLAASSFLGSLGGWIITSNLVWLIGGILIVSVIPFTLIAILPTNKQLLDPSLDRNSKLASDLLKRWGKLHAVRSALSTTALLVFLLEFERF
ncbi:MAG: DUF1772 domain-containing protein [Acidobacteriaceae bacterium]|nr:DUF1772 domain-containing protein [Acidobacteriaceae bacterium]